MVNNTVRISVPTHIAACCHITTLFVIGVCLFLFSNGKNQNVLWNHSHYTNDSLSTPHFSQQSHDDTVSTSVQPLVYTQETVGNMCSSFVSRPLLPHGSSAHIFLRAPLAKSQAKQRQLRSLRPSRSSDSLNSHSATTTQVFLSSDESHLSPGRCCEDNSTHCCFSGCVHADV